MARMMLSGTAYKTTVSPLCWRSTRRIPGGIKLGRLAQPKKIAYAAPWHEGQSGKVATARALFLRWTRRNMVGIGGRSGSLTAQIKPQRLVIATTDPEQLPDLTTWYLTTNLPAPDSQRAREGKTEAATAKAVVKL